MLNSHLPLQVFRDITFIDLSTLPWPKQGPKPSTVHGYVQKVLSLYSTQFSQVHPFPFPTIPPSPRLLVIHKTF